MKSSKARTKSAQAAGLFLAVLVMTPVAGFAFQNDDLYAKGLKAEAAGDAIAARDAFCAITDPAFKDAASRCSTYKAEATRTLNRYNQNYLEGLQLMQDGKFDEAEFKFRNVKAGDRKADAQRKIGEIAGLKEKAAQAKAAGEADNQGKQRLDQGIEAFNRGDFGSARSTLQGVTGSNAGTAQGYLSRIGNFEAKMAEANGFAGAKNYAGAMASYADAAAIAGNGPGDPRGKMREMQSLMSSASSATTTPTTNPNTRPVNTAAVKDVVKQIDVGTYLAEAKKAAAKGDYKRARRFFNDIIAQDFRNAAAKAGLEALPKEEPSTVSAAGEEDPALAAAINQFYKGNYDDAEARLQYYLVQGGKKTGLSNFYMGVCQLTRYYLSGENDTSLLSKARSRFKEAKAVTGFTPPEKFVSPKILKVFKEAS